LIIAAAVLGVVVLYDLGVMSYVERFREMATLKVIGFKDKKIGGLLIWQNMLLTVVGIILGIPAALGVLKFLVINLAKEYELRIRVSTLSFIISIALVLGVSLIVALMIARKNKKIDMVEALKAQE
ncbi:MAG: FtsX-like permease family protein, partial [Clostridia bacterium]|nr:FtsX-like permease family protein [Clostridia bacterium]